MLETIGLPDLALIIMVGGVVLNARALKQFPSGVS